MLRFDLPTISWSTPMSGSVASRVWDYTIGGYQVIKKWLSYREHRLLGRPLTTDEAREVMNIASFNFRGHSSLALKGAYTAPIPLPRAI